MQFDFFAYLACKLIIDCVSRACCDDASLDGFAYKGKVANDIQQLMTCRFVVPYQRNVIDITQLGGIHVGNTHYVSQFVIIVLAHFFFVDDNGIVQITAFNQAGS